jgi:hypothetical protein
MQSRAAVNNDEEGKHASVAALHARTMNGPTFRVALPATQAETQATGPIRSKSGGWCIFRNLWGKRSFSPTPDHRDKQQQLLLLARP